MHFVRIFLFQMYATSQFMNAFKFIVLAKSYTHFDVSKINWIYWNYAKYRALIFLTLRFHSGLLEISIWFFLWYEIVHCELSAWSNWSWNISNQVCGVATRSRTKLKTPVGGGDRCRAKYGCQSSCLIESKTRPCPGIWLSEFILIQAVI